MEVTGSVHNYSEWGNPHSERENVHVGINYAFIYLKKHHDQGNL